MAFDAPVVLLAGNGVIGRAGARRFLSQGCRVTVCHTGRNRIPSTPVLGEIIMERRPLPIVVFPSNILKAAEGAVVVHVQCMGAADGEAYPHRYVEAPPPWL